MAFEPNFDLLKELCETPGVSGREEPIRAVVAGYLRDLCDDVQSDAMGNVIGTTKGAGKRRVLLSAHMDEIGFMVSHIDDKGFLRLQPLGGWNARNMITQRVYIHGYAGQRLLGALQPPRRSGHDASKPFEIDDLYVDVGLSAEEVKALVEPGDPVTMARTTERVGNNILSKTLDDRVCVFIMLETLRRLKEVGTPEADILAVASVQEEVGLRGAMTMAYHLQPDVGIALDVTDAADHPDSSPGEYVTELGKGPALKIKDGYSISFPKIVRHFRDVAEANSIPYQLELLKSGGTDAGAIHTSRGGVPSFTMSLPSRYLHTVNEMAAWSDIEACIELLAHYLVEAHSREYANNIE